MLRRKFYACLAFGCLTWPNDAQAAAADERPHRLPLQPPLPAPCFEACQWAVRPLLFNDTAGLSPNPRVRSCQSPLDLTSLYLCTRAYCDGAERDAGLGFLNATCQGSVNVSVPPYEELVGNYTGEDVARVRRFSQEEWEGAATFPEAVIASDELYALVFDTLYSWGYAYGRHISYGYALFVFWAVVVAIGLLNRVIGALAGIIKGHRQGWTRVPLEEVGEDGYPMDHDPETKQIRSSTWWKRYVALPATFGYRSSQPFGWYTVPPRIQSLTIFAFVVVNIVFCAQGYRVFPGNLYFPKPFTQAWRYLSDRTGIVSFANFPLIWLFGMRNNVLMWLTGWDFGTYNNFHRWVARVSTVEAIIHSVGYTVLVCDRGGWELFAGYWKILWWTTGELATIFMCALLPLSLYFMRRNAYEAFLIIHILLSVVVLATMWFHVSVFKARYYQIVWICVFIWVLDRVLRVLRTLSFNPRFWNTVATATYDKDANMVRLSIPYGTSFYQPKPGTYYYLHHLDDVRFWESHPFTVSSIRAVPDPTDDVEVDDDDCQSYEELGESISLLTGRISPRAYEPNDSDNTGGNHDNSRNHHHKTAAAATSQASPTINFLIRPYDSSTRRLAHAASATWPEPAQMRVIVEGPYGHTRPFHTFESLLFVVGGSGIVVPLSYLDTILQAAVDRSTDTTGEEEDAGDGARAGSPLRRRVDRRVHVVWAVREPAFVSSVLRRDLRDLTRRRRAHDGVSFTLDVYVTGAADADSDCIELDKLPSGFNVLHDRPDVRDEVRGAARELGVRERLAVVACGPARMADDARKAVVDVLGTGRQGSSIEYFEESFNW